MAVPVDHAAEAARLISAYGYATSVSVRAQIHAILAVADAIDRQTAVLEETRKDTEYLHRPRYDTVKPL